MSVFQRAKYNWHCFWYMLNEQLLRDCVDDHEKAQIYFKVTYHRNKMFSI